MDHLEALRRLQESDLAIARLRTRLAEARHAPDAAATGLHKMESLLERARSDHQKARKDVHLKEGEVAELAARRKPLEEKLNRAATARVAETAQREITQLGERIAAMEEDLLALMESEEEAAGMVRQTEAAMEKLRARHSSQTGELPVRLREIEAEIEREQGDRETFRGRCEEADLERYRRLADRLGGRVVVEVDESCPGCDASFTEGQVQELLRNRDKIQTCPSCGRLAIFVGVERL